MNSLHEILRDQKQCDRFVLMFLGEGGLLLSCLLECRRVEMKDRKDLLFQHSLQAPGGDKRQGMFPWRQTMPELYLAVWLSKHESAIKN
jgi:hypothetical protein